jgi:hypothetical protein
MELDVEDKETSNVSRKSEYRHWRALSDGFGVTLLIVGPTSLFAELWRGAPIIDQGYFLWLLPAAIMTIGFYMGGGIAGRFRRTQRGAMTQGLLVASLTVPMIFLADMIRRLLLHQTTPLAVFAYWVGAYVAASLVSMGGALMGRRAKVQSYKRRKRTRQI